MEIRRVKADDEDSAVSITGLHASQHYLISVESHSASGISSAGTSSIRITTLSDGTTTVLCTVLVTLAAVLAVLLITVAVFYFCRYLKLFSHNTTNKLHRSPTETIASHDILGFGAILGVFSYFWCKISHHILARQPVLL